MPIRSLSEKQLLLIGRYRLIGDILCFVRAGRAALFHGSQHGALQQGLLLAQLFFVLPHILGRLCHFNRTPSLRENSLSFLRDTYWTQDVGKEMWERFVSQLHKSSHINSYVP